MRIITLTIILACGTFLSAPAEAQSIAQGRRIALTHCASCHAIEKAGASPNPRSPPFRVIGRKYKVDDLDEAFAEGIVTGHPGMPEFTLEPPHIEALLAYIKQVSRRARR